MSEGLEGLRLKYGLAVLTDGSTKERAKLQNDDYREYVKIVRLVTG